MCEGGAALEGWVAMCEGWGSREKLPREESAGKVTAPPSMVPHPPAPPTLLTSGSWPFISSSRR